MGGEGSPRRVRPMCRTAEIRKRFWAKPRRVRPMCRTVKIRKRLEGGHTGPPLRVFEEHGNPRRVRPVCRTARIQERFGEKKCVKAGKKKDQIGKL